MSIRLDWRDCWYDSVADDPDGGVYAVQSFSLGCWCWRHSGARGGRQFRSPVEFSTREAAKGAAERDWRERVEGTRERFREMMEAQKLL